MKMCSKNLMSQQHCVLRKTYYQNASLFKYTVVKNFRSFMITKLKRVSVLEASDVFAHLNLDLKVSFSR